MAAVLIVAVVLCILFSGSRADSTIPCSAYWVAGIVFRLFSFPHGLGRSVLPIGLVRHSFGKLDGNRCVRNISLPRRLVRRYSSYFRLQLQVSANGSECRCTVPGDSLAG